MPSPSLAIVSNRTVVKSGVRVAPPLILFLLALLTRLPLQSRMLYHWDSVNFAFAVRKFDMAAGQPHAPGYLLYVLLGRAAAALAGSAEKGYVLLAILGTALSACALYDLGRRLWNPRAGWFASLLLLTSPLFWFYGEVALPHTLDALMVIVAASLSWRIWRGEARLAPLLALWLGLSGGMREQTLVFLLPLAVVACLRLPWRIALLSAVILTATTLAWLIPLLYLSGGWAHYWYVVNAYSRIFDTPTSVFLGAGWNGLYHNGSKLIRYTLWAWAFGLIPLALGLGVLRRAKATPWRLNPRGWLLALWAAPSLFFYVFIHMGQQGLIFVYLPVCFLLSARAGDALTRQYAGGLALVAGCLAANALVYLFAPMYLLPGQRLKVLSEATIRDRDRALEGEVEAVRTDLPPGGVLLADEWRLPQYYLPQVPLVPYHAISSEETGVAVPLEPVLLRQVQSATALAWYEPWLDAPDQALSRTTLMESHNGVRLRVLRRAAGEHFWVTSSAFGVAPN